MKNVYVSVGGVVLNTNKAMQNIGIRTIGLRQSRQENVTAFRIGIERREDDAVFVSFYERTHTDAGRRETHVLAFAQESLYFREQYMGSNCKVWGHRHNGL